MKCLTEYLKFHTRSHRAYVHITPQVEQIVTKSGVQEGMVLVSAMHITAGVYVNDNESGLIEDIDQWLEKLAPFRKDYKHHDTGEDNGDSHLKALLNEFVNDPELAAAYRQAPAAKTLHHAYIGGLLDHVVSLFRSCDLVCRNYPQVNRDLVLAGAFLHDIGKIHELTYNRSFSYSTRGQLLGHMIIELEMLQNKLKKLPDFPPRMRTLVDAVYLDDKVTPQQEEAILGDSLFEQAMVLVCAPCARPGCAKVSVRQLRA